MEKIENPEIEKLATTLANVFSPTPAEIRKAMLLAYQCGKNDGALEVSERLLTAHAPKAAA